MSNFIESSMFSIKSKIEESANDGEKSIIVLSGMVNLELLSAMKFFIFLNYPRSVKDELSMDEIQISIIPKNKDIIINVLEKKSEITDDSKLENTVVTILSIKSFNLKSVTEDRSKLVMVEYDKHEKVSSEKALMGTVLSVKNENYLETLYSLAENVNHA